jgi:hypothetical protein
MDITAVQGKRMSPTVQCRIRPRNQLHKRPSLADSLEDRLHQVSEEQRLHANIGSVWCVIILVFVMRTGIE